MAVERRVPRAIPALLVLILAVFSAAILGTRTSAHTGHTSGLEFQLSVLSPHVCGPSAQDGKTACSAQQYEGSFTVGVWLADTSGIAQSSWYEAGFTLAYNGDITSLDDPAIVHPLCVNETSSIVFGVSAHAQCLGANGNYNGLVGTAGFECNAFGGTITLVHGVSETFVVDSFGVTHTDAGPDTLTINCVDEFTTYTPTNTRTPRPTPTPTPPPVGGMTGLANAGPPSGDGRAVWLLGAVLMAAAGCTGGLIARRLLVH